MSFNPTRRGALYLFSTLVLLLASCAKTEVNISNLHNGTERYWRVIAINANGQTQAPTACEALRLHRFAAAGSYEQLNNLANVCPDVPASGLDERAVGRDTFLVRPYSWVYQGGVLTIANPAQDSLWTYQVTELSKNQMVLVRREEQNTWTFSYQPFTP